MDDLMKKLTPIQYSVTQEDATEAPFTNEYWNFDKDGIFIDIVSGEALFSSKDKFFYEGGWPAFSKPIEETKVQKHPDFKLGYPRIEVRSLNSDSHLGHVFDDGPNGQPRYCINSASLLFVPKEEMEAKGYAKYLEILK